MLKKKWLWIALAALVVVALVAVNLSRGSKGKGEPVQLARVRVDDITAIVRAPGKVEPKTQVQVSADIPGKITRLLVKEGERVRRGQLMLQIDAIQYGASLDQARAALASAQARVREAENSYKVTESNFGRQRSLFEKNLLSQAEWDNASRTFESARATLHSAREEVARSRAVVTAASDNVRKTQFHAPFDGVVSALNVEEGEIVITGTMNNPGTQILTVSDLSRMLVRADVDETDVVDMQVGQKAKITVDALPDTSFPGTVIEIGSTAKRSMTSAVEGQTNFEVEVVFDHDVPAVRPGMTADVEIETATRTRTNAVPIQAVVVRTDRELERAAQEGKKSKPKKGDAIAADEDTVGKKEREITGVFVVRDGVAKFVPVRTGIASETMIEVLADSVRAGDQIVSGPYKALRDLKPNAKVKPETAGPRRGGAK